MKTTGELGLDLRKPRKTVSKTGRIRRLRRSYDYKLPAYAGPAPARGETERLSISPRLAGIANSYIIKLLKTQ